MSSVQSGRVDVAGRQRSYTLAEPPDPGPGASLVLVFHGQLHLFIAGVMSASRYAITLIRWASLILPGTSVRARRQPIRRGHLT